MSHSYAWTPTTSPLPDPRTPAGALPHDIAAVAALWVDTPHDDLRRAGPDGAAQIRWIGREDRHHFRVGVEAMVAVLQPSSVIVHGPMPDRIFDGLTSQVQFVRFPSDIETGHRKAA